MTTLTDRALAHLREHGPATVRAMLEPLGVPDTVVERDRLSVAVLSLVRVGAVEVVGTMRRGNGGAGTFRYVGPKPWTHQPALPNIRQRVLDALANGGQPMTSREVWATFEGGCSTHRIRVHLTTLCAQGVIARAGAVLVGDRPEILWEIT